MVSGAFSFLLFLFSSPQTVLTNKVSGTWEVVVDSTSTYRDYWRKIYAFEHCDDPSGMSCLGSYGFVDEPDVLTNVLDRAYFEYGISKKKDKQLNSRFLHIDDDAYVFTLQKHQDELWLYDSTRTFLMKMVRRN